MNELAPGALGERCLEPQMATEAQLKQPTVKQCEAVCMYVYSECSGFWVSPSRMDGTQAITPFTNCCAQSGKRLHDTLKEKGKVTLKDDCMASSTASGQPILRETQGE